MLRCLTQNLWLKGDTTYVGSNGSATFSMGTSSNSGWVYSSTTGTQFYAGTHIDNTVDTISSNTGSFFTWKKATADTGGGFGQSGTVTNSVCPQGWSLPSGGTGGNFDKLYNTAYGGSYSNFNAVWGGALIGYCYENCIDETNGLHGTYAFWWGSGQHNNNFGRDMSMTGLAFNPVDNLNKSGGFSVRCMLSGN